MLLVYLVNTLQILVYSQSSIKKHEKPDRHLESSVFFSFLSKATWTLSAQRDSLHALSHKQEIITSSEIANTLSVLTVFFRHWRPMLGLMIKNTLL